MTDSYLASCGIPKEICTDIISFRDMSQRTIAQIRRRSAAQIIKTLAAWQNEAKPFEEIVGDALNYLGFRVERLAKVGEPEGIATAYITPDQEDQASVYKLTFDAKSTKHGKVQTGNVHIAGLARHRDTYGADFALVVAPDFQAGALDDEAKSNKVTPMSGPTLAKLMSLSAGYGSISLTKLKEVFSFYTPKEVDDRVAMLEMEMEQVFTLELPTLINVLTELTTEKKMDILSSSTIAQKYRELTGINGKPTTSDIAKWLQGLSLMAPTTIRIDLNRPEKVFLLSDPSILLLEIKRNIDQIPTSFKLGSLAKIKE